MARVRTNFTSLAVATEASLGTLPGSPTWYLLEPNEINNYGAELSKVARNPISKNRRRQKGTTTDLDSSVEFGHDLTMEFLKLFLPKFFFSSYKGPAAIDSVNDTLVAAKDPETTGDDGFTHDALSAALASGTLVYTRGFSNSANNGLHEVQASSTTTATLVDSTLTAESPTAAGNAKLEVAGVRGTSSDLTWTDATNTVGSTTLDFTTLSLTVGQFIHIGGTATANQFSNGTAFGRISSISANSLVLDKVKGPLKDAAADQTGSGKSIDLLFGRFVHDVDVDDSDFLEESEQFELALPNLQNPDGTGDEYEYAEGNFNNQLAFNLPGQDKATVTPGFVGTDTDPPTTTRATNASTPVEPNETDAFNTSADFLRLRITEVDETGLTTDFKTATITINNQASAEKALATLGAVFMNIGNILFDIEAQILFTDSDVAAALRNNTTVTMDWGLKNDDGGFMMDVPALTLGGGGKDFPVNETVLLNLTGETHEDPTLGYSASVSLFPVLPA